MVSLKKSKILVVKKVNPDNLQFYTFLKNNLKMVQVPAERDLMGQDMGFSLRVFELTCYRFKGILKCTTRI